MPSPKHSPSNGSELSPPPSMGTCPNGNSSFCTLLDDIDDLLMVIGDRDEILRTNKIALHHFGPEEVLVGTSLLDLYPPEKRKQAEQSLASIRVGKTHPHIYPLVRRDGTQRRFDTTFTRTTWMGKSVLLGVFRDVTGRQLTQDALREREELFRQLALRSPNPLVLSISGKITFANDAAEQLLRSWSADVLVGRPLSDFVPESLCVSGDSRRVLLHTLEGERLMVRWRSVPLIHTAEHAVLHTFQPEEPPPGSFNAHLEVFEQAQAGLLLANEKKTIIKINARGRELLDSESLSSIDDLSILGHPVVLDELLQSPSGTAEFEEKRGGRVFALSAKKITSPQAPALYLLALEDISRRKHAENERLKLEAQIQQAQKLESLGVLAGGIAHDFNNLLVGILGNAGLALLDLPVEAPARRSVIEIERAAKRATDLVRQMLAYSGKGRFLVESISLRRVAEEMTHLLQVSVSKGAVLRFDFAASVPPVKADATQIRQVLMNLVTNASDAIGDQSGVISISTGAMVCDKAYLSETYLDDDLPEGLYSYLEVSDTGCGMDHEMRRRVFDPFFTTKFTGRGLGLAAVLGIVRGHRGAIKVYSELGKGTVFKALFPALEIKAEPDPPRSRELEEELPQGTILLVDDEETVRAVGSRMLKRLGFEVDTAPDGREGLKRYQEDPERYCCVILDLTMPHMDGETCFRELRRVRKDVRVPLCSGYNEQELTARFAGKGLAGFMQKPYQLKTLREKLLEAFGKK